MVEINATTDASVKGSPAGTGQNLQDKLHQFLGADKLKIARVELLESSSKRNPAMRGWVEATIGFFEIENECKKILRGTENLSVTSE